MRKLFEDLQLREKFNTIVDSWIGTPYHHMWHTKGRGVDCSLLVGELYKELGVLEKVIVSDYYPTDWHINAKINLLEETVKKVKLKENYSIEEVDDLYFGDILLFTLVKTGIPHHSGVLLENNLFVQAGNSGVTKTLLDTRWRRHMKKIYRIYKLW